MGIFERDRHLAELISLLRDSVATHGRLVLLGGEAGVGKTTLVNLFRASVGKTAHVFIGSCDPLSTPRPLGPLLDVAAALSSELEQLLLSEAPRERIFRQFLATLTAQTSPTILIFEDMHWADEASLDLLRFLGRRLQTIHTLCVVTYRDDEVGPRHPLRVLLGDLATTASVRRLMIPPLSVDGVRALAAASALDPVALYEQTGGNPFFVTEVLASAASGIPATVRDAVLGRIARLSPAARHVLDAAAVIGARVEPWLLQSLLGSEIEAVDECLAVGVLQPQGDYFGFRHELGRNTILEALSPYQRPILHRKILVALQHASTEHSDVARLAHHAEAAGEHEAVLTYAPQAALRAAALKAHREAAAQYARALRYAANLPPEAQARLFEAWSYECYLTDQLHDAIAGRQSAIAIWRQVGDRLKEGENQRWLSRYSWFVGQNAAAWEAADIALAILEQLPRGPQLAMAYSNRAQLHMLSQERDEAIRWGNKAVELAEQLGDSSTLSHAFNNIGMANLYAGFEEGRTQLEHSLQLARRTGFEEHVARAYTNLSTADLHNYRFALADGYLAAGISYCIEHDLESWRLYMLSTHSLSLCMQGNWSEATIIADQVLRHPNVSPISRIQALVVLGRVRARRGDPGVAAALDQALALATPTYELLRLGIVRIARAEAAWLTGDLEQAREEAFSVYALAVRCNDQNVVGELGLWLRRAGEQQEPYLALNEPFRLHCDGMWQEAAAAWRRVGCPYEAALALADSGDPELLRQAFSEFEQLGAQATIAAFMRHLRDRGVQGVPRGARQTTRANPSLLTSREIEILRLIAAGLRNAAIAQQLSITPKTVGHHVSAILSKLGVDTRTAAAQKALELGIVTPDRTTDKPK